MGERPLLVIDSDAHSGAALAQALQAQGVAADVQVAGGLDVPAAVARAQPDIVLFNHHFDQPGDLLACCAARLYAPDAAIVGLAAAGPGIKLLRQWNAQQACLHAVLEKPLQPGQLATFLRELAQRRGEERQMRERAERLARLVPAGAEQASADAAAPEEMFEGAVVFTDIRRSSELITSQPPRAFFHVLNESLSAQGAQVRAWKGSVVKYTGDGMLAVFRGMGRSHLAMRCALSLAEAALQDPMGFGIGVAEGLLLAGLVGDFDASGQQQQYDVFGSTVHLAARLCAQAEPGQVIATRDIVRGARVQAREEALGAVRVRGFPSPVECVRLTGAPPRLATIERFA